MYCRHCGKEINDGTNFCNYCGKNLKKNTESQPPIVIRQVQPKEESMKINQAQQIKPKTKPQKPQKVKKSKKGLVFALGLVFLVVIVFIGIKQLGLSSIFKGDKKSKITEHKATNEIVLKDLGKAEFIDTESEFITPSVLWGAFASNQILVMLEDTYSIEKAEEIAASISGKVVGDMELINLYQIELPKMIEGKVISLVNDLIVIEGVEAAFPNVVTKQLDVKGKSCSPLKDPIFELDDNAKHYEIIGMADAWKIIKASKIALNNVFVGVLDSAIYTKTSEFNGKVKLTGDRTSVPDELEYGELNHGTMVTHVIGANGEDGGMVGVASMLEEKLNINVVDDSSIFPEGMNTNVPIDSDDLTQAVFEGENNTWLIASLVGLKKMVESGQTVINCSFGPKIPSDSNSEINKAYKKFFEKVYQEHPEVVFVAAAGNEGRHEASKGELTGANYWPGGISIANVITVGAINNDGSKAEFSNYASESAEVTLSAPGVEMVLGIDETGDKTGKPIRCSGTSFSAPQVTATIALMQSINPELKAGEIKKILMETAVKGVTTGNQSIPIPKGMGAGVLRVDEAVLRVINDLREKNNLDPFEREYLLDCSSIELVAEGSDLDYTITATIKKTLGKNADVKIEVSGDHSLKGKTTQSVSGGDAAQWKIILEDKSVFVKVIRLDTNDCAYLTLTPENIKKESGDLNVTELTFYSSFYTFDDLKKSMSEKNYYDDDRLAYLLYDAGIIYLDEQGNFNFSGTATGYEDSDETGETIRGPMSFEINAKINIEALKQAIKEANNHSIEIGTGNYSHNLTGVNESRFSRGDYERNDYTENATCELNITYYAPEQSIIFTSKDHFEKIKIGTHTSSYGDSKNSSPYEDKIDSNLYLQFKLGN